MDGVSWIKLDADILDNRKIKQIRKMPDGFAIIYVWLGLLTVAAKTNGNGFVYFTEDIPYTEQLLSNEFDMPIATIQLALKTFEHFHMIEIIDDVICISNWAEYQNVDGLKKIREQGRKRVQAYRERQKIALDCTAKEETTECNVTCNVTDNVTVTQSSLSISNSKKQTNKKNKKEYEKIEDIPREYIDILDAKDVKDELKAEFLYFILMRLQSSKKYTLHALELSINKVRKLYPDDINKQIECVDQSIERGWEGLFEVRGSYNRYGATGVKLAEETDHSLDGIF